MLAPQKQVISLNKIIYSLIMSFSHRKYKFLRQAPRGGFNNGNKTSFWQRLHLDPWLLLFILLNISLGIIVLYSASTENIALVTKQIISFSIGFAIMVGLAQIPPKLYQAFSPYFYAIGILGLLLVMIFGEIRMGAQRWIDIGGFGSVQPSEFLKIGMPLMLAWYLSRHSLPPTLKQIGISLILIAIPFLLIAEQPDLGTSLLVLASGIFVLFLSGLSWKVILTAFVAIAAIIPIAWQYLLHDYQRRRVETLFNPETDTLGAGWNIMQSKTAIGSGGISGKGYLEGTQSHLQFLPEAHTDFIIAAFSEEFGLIGVILLNLLYLAIIIRVFQIGLKNPDSFSRLVAGAYAMSFFIYVFVNSGMVSGLLPIVGVPLPFMSYGGTAIITLMATFGIIMSIHTHR